MKAQEVAGGGTDRNQQGRDAGPTLMSRNIINSLWDAETKRFRQKLDWLLAWTSSLRELKLDVFDLFSRHSQMFHLQQKLWRRPAETLCVWRLTFFSNI